MYKKHANYVFILIISIFFIGIIIIISSKILDYYQDINNKKKIILNLDKNEFIIGDNNSELLYFYEPKPNTKPITKTDWLGYNVENTINFDSLNERYDYSINKNSKNYRIITLGDSFTYGYLVSTSENYTEVLEDLLNAHLKCQNYAKFEVINLGMPGYDITYSVERFIKRGNKYTPDLVIWLLQDFNFKYNEYLLPLEEKLINNGVLKFNPLSRSYPASYKAIQEIYKMIGDKQMINLSTENLYKITDVYKGKILFVTFSFIPQDFRQRINNFINLNPNILYFENLTNIYNTKSNFLLDAHPSIAGHQVIAQDIYNYLAKNIIKCNLTDVK